MEINPCSVDGCDRSAHTKGMCRPHYESLKRTGDPLKRARPKKDPNARCKALGCENKVDHSDLCLKHYMRFFRHGDENLSLNPLHGKIHLRKHKLTYSTWHGMHNRCKNPKHPAYHRYGGRGIYVCERWSDFLNFMADMGERPVGRWLDRIDNDGIYEKNNCRWVTPKESAANRSTSRRTKCQSS